MMKRKTRIAVGLSGGVDSSVAACLLKEQGYEVVGLTMKIFDGRVAVKATRKHACYGPGEEEDIASAAAVCEKLGIPFHVIDLSKAYHSRVIGYFRDEYLSGKTPNPCVVCNQQLKFGFLLSKARASGIQFDAFATGHYARIERRDNRFLLKKAADPTKDQTYFLHALTPDQLSTIRFPLGDCTKAQVREMARGMGLSTAERDESQDFIDGGDYAALFNESEVSPGEIVDESGTVLGTHRGIIYYTIGQRRGLGIASDRPLYVLKIDAAKNQVVVTDKENLFSEGLIAGNMNLIVMDRLDQPFRVTVKIRLRHRETPATVFPHEGGRVLIRFDHPQKAVTPGQSAVLYDGDVVFGGGVIERAV